MVGFVARLGAVDHVLAGGVPSVGRARVQAKQEYFLSLQPGTFSHYDEKVLGEMTLSGLPMLKVAMPNRPSDPPSVSGPDISLT